jgi:hypothetical protein
MFICREQAWAQFRLSITQAVRVALSRLKSFGIEARSEVAAAMDLCAIGPCQTAIGGDMAARDSARMS